MNLNSRLLMQVVGSILASILILWGIFALFTKPQTTEKVQIDIRSDDHVRGKADAPVTLVEYSDLQCPACAAYAPLVKTLLSKNETTVRLVYRHFPLDQHVHAREAAYAAEAAGKQGKFFEYHDFLFDNQKEWEADKDVSKQFKAYAQDLKLDISQFEKDIKSPAIRKRVDDDQTSALATGVNSTPTFFINGVKIENPRSIEEFQKAIDDALKSASPSAGKES